MHTYLYSKSSHVTQGSSRYLSYLYKHYYRLFTASTWLLTFYQNLCKLTLKGHKGFIFYSFIVVTVLGFYRSHSKMLLSTVRNDIAR